MDAERFQRFLATGQPYPTYPEHGYGYIYVLPIFLIEFSGYLLASNDFEILVSCMRISGIFIMTCAFLTQRRWFLFPSQILSSLAAVGTFINAGGYLFMINYHPNRQTLYWQWIMIMGFYIFCGLISTGFAICANQIYATMTIPCVKELPDSVLAKPTPKHCDL